MKEKKTSGTVSFIKRLNYINSESAKTAKHCTV